MGFSSESRHRRDCTAVVAAAQGELQTVWSAAVRIERKGPCWVGSSLASTWEVAPCADPRCPAERWSLFAPLRVPGEVNRPAAALEGASDRAAASAVAATARPRSLQRAIGVPLPKRIGGLSAGALR
jgi:hypothetical protein